MSGVLAAVSTEAFELMRSAAPDGVDVQPLADADLTAAGFVVPGWDEVERLAELRASSSVRVVQVLSAGTDWVEEHVPPQAVLCNARGARDVPVAEWVVGALLGACTGLLEAARDRRWAHRRGGELAGSTVVVLGSGSIGEAVRERLEPFGARVEAVARHARPGVHAADALPGLLPDASALVILLPLTEATRGAVGAAELRALPDGAIVVNAGRGAVLDAEALAAEVGAGRLRAVLDVTEPEPLPPGHPLWAAPGVLAITGHHAGDSREADRRAAELAAAQLARFAAGEPLANVVGGPRDPA